MKRPLIAKSWLAMGGLLLVAVMLGMLGSYLAGQAFCRQQAIEAGVGSYTHDGREFYFKEQRP